MLNLELLKDENGFYPDDIAKILTTRDPEKKRILRDVGTKIIKYSQYLDAWDWLVDVFEEADTGQEATAGLLYGRSGVGKSTVLRQFVGEYGRPLSTPSGVKRAVIRVSTPANPTLPNILVALLYALGAEEVADPSAKDLDRVVTTQLRKQDVKLIIFDEFTHIVEDRSERFATKAVRGLKELLSENVCQCVFAGTQQLQNVHTLYQQFRRRSGGDFEMRPFDWDDEDDQKEWVLIMKGLQEKLPIRFASPLGKEAMARRMHVASDGLLDHVMKLIFRATSFAYDDGETLISDANLSAAFERLRRGDKKRVNPFGKPSRRNRGIKIVDDVASATEEHDPEEKTRLVKQKRSKPGFSK